MKKLTSSLADLLNAKVEFYNQPDFIHSDPLSIPRIFQKKEDIEIAGFLSAIIAWGNRKSIINNANRLISLLEHHPHEFLLSAREKDLKRFDAFVHRTFNGIDSQFFITRLQLLYQDQGGLEELFMNSWNASKGSMALAIHQFKKSFFSIPHLPRTTKHLPDPLKGSAAKRLNMFFRWMVRKDETGVDFGIWKNMDPSQLIIPLDVHTGNVSRKLGLLQRKQNDWKAAMELTEKLRLLDPKDPVKYDFALFGMGVFEKVQ